MLKLIVCKGLPGSGKSTWAKEYVLKNQDTVRVNRDDLRHMLGIYWMPKREKLVTAIEYDAVESALMRGYNVIVDATGFNTEHKWSALVNSLVANDIAIGLQIKDFTHVPLKECIQRDQQREKPVGKMVIERMYYQYLNKDEDNIS